MSNLGLQLCIDEFLRNDGSIDAVADRLRQAIAELEMPAGDAEFVRRALARSVDDGKAVLQTFNWFLLTVPGVHDMVTCGRCGIVLCREHTDEDCAVAEVMIS